MRKSLIVLLVLGFFSSCKDKCLTCPENYVVKNNQCHCESGYIEDGKCYEKEYLKELNIFIQEETEGCEGFEPLVYFKYMQHNFVGTGVEKENVYFFDETSAVDKYRVFEYTNDSFYAPSWIKNSMLGVSNSRTLGNHERQIDGKTCYLRFNMKVVSPNHLRLYFFWMTKEDELKSDYCIRNFYQPF